MVVGSVFGAVNSLAVYFQPLADSFEYILLMFHHGTVSFRPDIEQIVPPAGDYSDKVGDFFVDFFLNGFLFLP